MVGFADVAAIAGAVSAAFFKARSFGGIIPSVTIEEVLTDRVVVTKHPVQHGASITDHAYKEPAIVMVKVAWTDASLFLQSVTSGAIFSGEYSTTDELYAEILALQESRELFDVVTGRREYENCLVTEIVNTTDRESENSLFLTLRFEQVIITDSESVELAASENHDQPQDTAPVSKEGTKQPKAAPQQSILKKIFG